MVSRMRVEPQLQVSGSARERDAPFSQLLEGFDAGRVGGDEVRQIELDGNAGRNLRACFEQFRELRDSQAAGQLHPTSIGLSNNTDPAIHGAAHRQDSSHDCSRAEPPARTFCLGSSGGLETSLSRRHSLP